MEKRTVQNIVVEQEKTRSNTKTTKSRAEVWLKGYLQGKGEIPAGTVTRDAENEGCKYSTLNRTANDLGIVRTTLSRGGTTWQLPTGGPRLYLSLGSMQYMKACKPCKP